MHILALIISLIAGVISFFQAGLLTMLGGIGGGLGEVFGDQSMADEIYMYGGMGLLVVIAAILGIIGGIMASLRKKAATAILLVSAGICILAAISGYSDAFIYAAMYGLAAVFAFLSFSNYEQASASNQSSPSSSGDRSLDTKQITSSHLERTCTNCEKVLDGDFQFCPNCGEKVEPIQEIPIRKCQNCGKEFEENFQFCPYCGGNIQTVFPEIPVPIRQEGQNIVDDSKNSEIPIPIKQEEQNIADDSKNSEMATTHEKTITTKNGKRFSNAELVFGILILLLLVVIGILSIYAMNKKEYHISAKPSSEPELFSMFVRKHKGWSWPWESRSPLTLVNDRQIEALDYFVSKLDSYAFDIIRNKKSNEIISKKIELTSIHDNTTKYFATAVATKGKKNLFLIFSDLGNGKIFLNYLYCTSPEFHFPLGLKVGANFSLLKEKIGNPSDRSEDYYYYHWDCSELIFQVINNKIISFSYEVGS